MNAIITNAMGIGAAVKAAGFAAVIAAAPLAGCDRFQKKAEAPVEEVVAISPEEQAAADAAAEAADVYAPPQLASVGAARTEDELRSAAATAFGDADSDGNGLLDKTEFYSLAALLAPTLDAIETSDDVFSEEPSVLDAPLDAIEAPAAEETLDNAAQAALDAFYAEIAGDDGLISAAEIETALLARFAQADEDSDGGLNDLESENFRSMRLFQN
jgi:hypothetical protein